jgi:histidine triad (HIT) family protein
MKTTYLNVDDQVLDSLMHQAEERHKDILGHLMYATALIAKQEGLDDGYRLVVNDGPKGCK